MIDNLARVQAALDGISAAPIKYLINTHWHWDHTEGNEWVHNQGATIIAHENVLKRLSAITRVEDWDYTLQPRPMSGRPTVTFKTEKTLKFDGETVLKNIGPGHTDGDAFVYFSQGRRARFVEVELCGATAAVHNWGNDDLLVGVKVNTNAIARISELAQEGSYKLRSGISIVSLVSIKIQRSTLTWPIGEIA